MGLTATGRHRYLSIPTETIEVRERTMSELLEAMGRTGFHGKSLARCLDVLVEMVVEPGNTVFLGYAGSLSTTGQWKIVRWLVERRFVDVVVSTGANVSEDVFEGLGFSYYQGSATRRRRRTARASDRPLLRRLRGRARVPAAGSLHRRVPGHARTRGVRTRRPAS